MRAWRGMRGREAHGPPCGLCMGCAEQVEGCVEAQQESTPGDIMVRWSGTKDMSDLLHGCVQRMCCGAGGKQVHACSES